MNALTKTMSRFVSAVAVLSMVLLPAGAASAQLGLEQAKTILQKDVSAQLQSFGNIPLRKLSKNEAQAVLSRIGKPASGKLRSPELNTHTCGHEEQLQCGIATTGTLQTGDCVLSSDNTLFDVWTFTGVAGQSVTITMDSTAVDSYLILLNPSGGVVDEDDDSNGGNNARITATLPSSGTYEVVTNTFAAGQTGSYTVRVSGAGCSNSAPPTCTPAETPIACGATATGGLTSTDCTLSDGTSYDVYTFSGTSGQSVTINMDSSAFDTYLLLANPSAQVVAENDDRDNSTNSTITFTLDSTGTWFILANSFSAGETGNYTLQLTCGTTGGNQCGPTTLCLQNNRFRVNVNWRAFDGSTGVGTVLPFSQGGQETGMFWFFNSSNVEMVVKILDGRPLNQRWWVFYGALTNVEFTLTVTDTVTGAVKQYQNPLGTFASVGDTNAFQ
jgi:hypothetical protein